MALVSAGCSALSWGNLVAHSSISQYAGRRHPAQASGLEPGRAAPHEHWALGLAVPWWVGSQLPTPFCGDQGGWAHVGYPKALLYLSFMAPFLPATSSSHVPAPILPVGAGTGPQVPVIQLAYGQLGWAVHFALSEGAPVAEPTVLFSQAPGDPALIFSWAFSAGPSPFPIR